jgi:K+-transporting ATPase ATPase B chain
MSPSAKARPLFDPTIARRAIVDSFIKLDPRHQVRNPVMFTVFVGSVITSLILIERLVAGSAGDESVWFVAGISAWLWFTVLFANFAEAMAEGRGKAQADALKATRQHLSAKKFLEPPANPTLTPDFQDLVKHGEGTFVPATDLRQGDVVLVETGDQIPGDGEVVSGVASVDESAITGESAPVIRESGGDRSSVTGGTRVLSDWLIVRITANPGESFLDRMIHLVEGARDQHTQPR